MNRKITFPELVDALSEVNGNSKKINESLLKDFFSLIQEALEHGESVKIKKLGVFKVVKVDARKSINVNTGKEIEIPEHFKVNFAPDKELADEVNAAFADFETIEIDDNISDEEINSNTEDIGIECIPKSETSDKDKVINNDDNAIKSSDTTEKDSINIIKYPPELPTDKKDNTIATEETKISEEQHSEIEIVPGNDSNVTNDEENINQNVPELPDRIAAEQESDNTSESATHSEDEDKEYSNTESDTNENKGNNEDLITSGNNSESLNNKEADFDNNSNKLKTEVDTNKNQRYQYDYEDRPQKSRNNFYKGFFCGVLFSAAAILISIYLFSVFAEFNITITNTEGIVKTEEKTVTEKRTEVQPIDTTSIDTVAIVKPSAEKIVLDTISRTRFLTTMAREYYGDYNFWVYIYEENKDIINNPDKIKLGTVVVIPPASKYNIDKNDPESVKKAQNRSNDIYKNSK